MAVGVRGLATEEVVVWHLFLLLGLGQRRSSCQAPLPPLEIDRFVSAIPEEVEGIGITGAFPRIRGGYGHWG